MSKNSSMTASKRLGNHEFHHSPIGCKGFFDRRLHLVQQRVWQGLGERHDVRRISGNVLQKVLGLARGIGRSGNSDQQQCDGDDADSDNRVHFSRSLRSRTAYPANPWLRAEFHLEDEYSCTWMTVW